MLTLKSIVYPSVVVSVKPLWRRTNLTEIRSSEQVQNCKLHFSSVQFLRCEWAFKVRFLKNRLYNLLHLFKSY